MRIVFGIVENFLEGGTGANATDVNFVVFDSADHVHVEHGDSFVERLGGIFDPGGGTEEAEFLTSEGGEENAALELAFHGGEEAGEFEEAGGAGGVVVGAGMDLADLRRSERIEIAATEVIVVSAEDEVFVGFAGEIGKDVVDGGASGLNADGKSGYLSGGKGEGSGLGGGVNLFVEVFEGFAEGLKPGIGNGIFDLGAEDADVFWAADAAKTSEKIFFAVREFAIDEDDGFCAVIAGIDSFGDELGVAGRPLMIGLGDEAERLVAEDEDNFVFNVEAGVVVVIKFFGGDAIAGEDDWGVDGTGGGKAEGDVILVEREGAVRAGVRKNE